MSTIKLKRSAVPGKIPLTTDLALSELAINTYDGKLYMKKNDGTEAVIQIGGVSSAPVGMDYAKVIATAGQTLIPLTFTFIAGLHSLMVFVQGVKQEDGVSYTETGGSAITFTAGLSAGDEVEVIQVGSAVNLLTNTTYSKILQKQTAVAFTTAGTATAYTLTPTPPIDANTANLRFRVIFHIAAGTTPTLSVSGMAAANLKYRDSTGTKQAISATQVPVSFATDVEFDGTDWVVLNIANLLSTTNIGSTVQAYDAQLSSLVRQNAQNAGYTCVLTDGGKHIYFQTAGTITIPGNATVAYPVGTVITFVNLTNATCYVACADNMFFAGTTNVTGTRTLTSYTLATAMKVGPTNWIISGFGVS